MGADHPDGLRFADRWGRTLDPAGIPVAPSPAHRGRPTEAAASLGIQPGQYEHPLGERLNPWGVTFNPNQLPRLHRHREADPVLPTDPTRLPLQRELVHPVEVVQATENAGPIELVNATGQDRPTELVPDRHPPARLRRTSGADHVLACRSAMVRAQSQRTATCSRCQGLR